MVVGTKLYGECRFPWIPTRNELTSLVRTDERDSGLM